MNKKRDFLFKFLRVVFELIFMINIFLVYFLDVKEIILTEGKYFSAIIEKHTIWVIVQNITNTVFGTVINPFLDWYVLILSFLGFTFC